MFTKYTFSSAEVINLLITAFEDKNMENRETNRKGLQNPLVIHNGLNCMNLLSRPYPHSLPRFV